MGFSLRVNHKKRAGASHPNRDDQFQHIAELRERCAVENTPVISVDTKKKELVGAFKNAGAKWDRAPVLVKDHDPPATSKWSPIEHRRSCWISGLAREANDGATLGGTLRYLSPEVLSGPPAEEGDDVWSLCVVLLPPDPLQLHEHPRSQAEPLGSAQKQLPRSGCSIAVEAQPSRTPLSSEFSPLTSTLVGF